MAILTQHPSWKTLCEHEKTISALHMRSLFEADPKRFERFSLKLDDILLDYSKHRITEETLTLLFQIAREAKIEDWRDRMFAGEKINITENRAVLHTALRNRSNTPVYVDGHDVMPDVNAVLDQMRVFQKRCVVVNGKAILVSASPILSTSGLVAQIWVQLWFAMH